MINFNHLLIKVLLIVYISITSKFVNAQINNSFAVEQKLDDILMELELQRMARQNVMDAYLLEQWRWPANLTPIYTEGDVTHYVNERSLLYQKPTFTARFYIIFPKIKNNRHGKYKAISVYTSINCELLTYTEVGTATYDENFKLQNSYSSSMDLIFSLNQKPFQRAYVKYLCKK